VFLLVSVVIRSRSPGGLVTGLTISDTSTLGLYVVSLVQNYLESVHQRCVTDRSGHLADYIPELFDVTAFPIMFTLMFTYLFGGALAGSPSPATSSSTHRPCRAGSRLCRRQPHHLARRGDPLKRW